MQCINLLTLLSEENLIILFGWLYKILLWYSFLLSLNIKWRVGFLLTWQMIFLAIYRYGYFTCCHSLVIKMKNWPERYGCSLHKEFKSSGTSKSTIRTKSERERILKKQFDTFSSCSYTDQIISLFWPSFSLFLGDTKGSHLRFLSLPYVSSKILARKIVKQ